MNAQDLVTALRASRGFLHKHDVSNVLDALGPAAIALGDDCAALPDGDGYLLLAIEGFVDDFVKQMPWFAGYCSIMVNVSDIHAMGGRPIAVVDALWSRGMDPAQQILAGMAAAAERYAVPIVGGHSNNRADRGQLAVAIMGRAKTLLSSFAARPGDELIVAVDLRGQYADPFPYWNASSDAPADRLRADLELLPRLAESGLCDAAKDISMAGAVGTLLMLLECSGVGATLDAGAFPRPPGTGSGAELLRWLTAFPSYGFVLSVRPARVQDVMTVFQQRSLSVAVVGQVTRTPTVMLRYDGGTASLWNFEEQAFMASRYGSAVSRAATHA